MSLFLSSCGPTAKGQASEPKQTAPDRPGGPDLVPGHYLVVVEPRSGSNNPQMLGVAKARALARSARMMAFARSKNAEIRYEFENGLIGFSAAMKPEVAAEINAFPRVRVVQNQWVRAADTQRYPPDGLDRIDKRERLRDRMYSYRLNGEGVHVYVIDSGIFVSEEFDDESGKTRVAPDVQDYVGAGSPDCSGHGTHVAGTIGGKTFGVAKKVTLHSVRVLDCNNRAQTDTVIAAVQWVIENAKAPAILNMSLFTSHYPDLDKRVMDAIRAKLTVVVAAGNLTADFTKPDACKVSPGGEGVPDAITVGNANPLDDLVASTSFIGPCVDLFAPGVSIVSSRTMYGAGGEPRSGTSMSAAHVSGVAALYLEAARGFPDWDTSPTGVWRAIDRASIPFGNASIWPWRGGFVSGSPKKLLHWGPGGYDGLADHPIP